MRTHVNVAHCLCATLVHMWHMGYVTLLNTCECGTLPMCSTCTRHPKVYPGGPLGVAAIPRDGWAYLSDHPRHATQRGLLWQPYPARGGLTYRITLGARPNGGWVPQVVAMNGAWARQGSPAYGGVQCRIPFGDHPLKLERYRED